MRSSGSSAVHQVLAGRSTDTANTHLSPFLVTKEDLRVRVRLAIHEVLECFDEEREAGLEVDAVRRQDQIRFRDGCGYLFTPTEDTRNTVSMV